MAETGFSNYINALSFYGALDKSILSEVADNNPYRFVNNNPIRNIDKFGLKSTELDPCCKCGKDVTKALTNTYNKVVNSYNSLKPETKNAVCYAFKAPVDKIFRDPIVKHMLTTGWDLNKLTWEWENNIQSFWCGNGKKCEDSVGVNGKCYWKWSVNYIAYGWINKLCGISKSTMMSRILGWKMIYKPIKDREINNPVYPMIWANIGYDNTLSGASPKFSKFSDCKSCGEEYNGDLESIWPNSNWTLDDVMK